MVAAVTLAAAMATHVVREITEMENMGRGGGCVLRAYPDHDGPWTVTIDWGDGSQPLTFQASEGPINGSHSYTGVALTEYTLTVTVVDAHGNRNSASKKVTVTLL